MVFRDRIGHQVTCGFQRKLLSECVSGALNQMITRQGKYPSEGGY